MPTYEYACTACGNEWETEQSIKADALKDCPKCHEATARRQISKGAGFILKGSGWYSDLYSSSSNKKDDSAGGKPSAEGSTSASTAPSTSTSSETSSSEKSSGEKPSGEKSSSDKPSPS